jgi:hypothetical protein
MSLLNKTVKEVPKPKLQTYMLPPQYIHEKAQFVFEYTMRFHLSLVLRAVSPTCLCTLSCHWYRLHSFVMGPTAAPYSIPLFAEVSPLTAPSLSNWYSLNQSRNSERFIEFEYSLLSTSRYTVSRITFILCWPFLSKLTNLYLVHVKQCL